MMLILVRDDHIRIVARLTSEINFKIDIVHRLLVFLFQVRQYFSIIFQTLRLERLECISQHHPSTDRSPEVLRIERS